MTRAAQVADIERVLDRHRHLLDIPKGSLLHKDMALWNIMGTENRIEAIIDWDDTIIGDPADDLGVLRCFYGDEILGPVWRAYAEIHPVDDAFRLRTSLYLVRNMLWKAVIRTSMKYFEMGGDFFLAGGGGGLPWDFWLNTRSCPPPLGSSVICWAYLRRSPSASFWSDVPRAARPPMW
jgi:hypothetical protein